MKTLLQYFFAATFVSSLYCLPNANAQNIEGLTSEVEFYSYILSEQIQAEREKIIHESTALRVIDDKPSILDESYFTLDYFDEFEAVNSALYYDMFLALYALEDIKLEEAFDFKKHFSTIFFVNLFRVKEDATNTIGRQSQLQSYDNFTLTDISSALILTLVKCSFGVDISNLILRNSTNNRILSKPRKLHANLRKKDVGGFSRSFTPFHCVLFSKGRDPPCSSYKRQN